MLKATIDRYKALADRWSVHLITVLARTFEQNAAVEERMNSNRKPKPPEPRQKEEAKVAAGRRSDETLEGRRPSPISRSDWPGEGVCGDHHTD